MVVGTHWTWWQWFMLGAFFGALVLAPALAEVLSDRIPADTEECPVVLIPYPVPVIPQQLIPKPEPKKPEQPARIMAAGELAAIWKSWEACKGEHCID